MSKSAVAAFEADQREASAAVLDALLAVAGPGSRRQQLRQWGLPD